jgi:cleavage and polyadenylation specificity factor subunit 2
LDILIDGFTPPSTSVVPMFPLFENTAEWDDFGEVINPDDYVIQEEESNHMVVSLNEIIFRSYGRVVQSCC